ncbi:hypothetical protein [Oricola sp.]|uniref:hypothetical protein n=1 Tax=Oricola sp. TaxID=1979950 RepID=UPI003BA8E8AA
MRHTLAQYLPVIYLIVLVALLAVVFARYYVTGTGFAGLSGPGEDGAARVLLASRSEKMSVPDQGMELGYGWDSRFGILIPARCVEFAPVSLTGQTTSVRLSDVSDKSEIMESLGVSASVAVNSVFAKGSAKASFARNSTVSGSSQTILLDAMVLNGTIFAGPVRPTEPSRTAYPYVDPAENTTLASADAQPATRRDGLAQSGLSLKPWAVRLLRENRAGFRRACGDAFIASIDTGASLVATFTIKSSNKAVADKAKAAIKGNYGAVAASAEASMQRSSDISTASTEIRVMQVGGSSGAIPVTQEGLQAKLGNLALEAARAPIFQTMTVSSYEGLVNWPADQTLATDRDDAEVIADYYWFLASFYDSIEDVLENSDDYSFATGLVPSELRDLQDQVVRLRASIRSKVGTLAGGETEEVATVAAISVPGGVGLALPETVFAAPPADTDESAEEFGEEAFSAFAGALRGAAQLENPNILRLNLPMPKSVAGDLTDEAELRRAAVAHHVGRQAKRMCRLDPADNECLTNAELSDLEALIPFSRLERPDGAMLQNIGDGTCIEARAATNSPLFSARCRPVMTAGTGRFTHTDRYGGAFGPTDTGRCAYLHGNQVYSVRCDDVVPHGWGWFHFAFDTTARSISLDDMCLESAGPGRAIKAAQCAKGGPHVGQQWRIVRSSDG